VSELKGFLSNDTRVSRNQTRTDEYERLPVSLTPDWFNEREKRKARRDREGVSLEEAERTLVLYSSSIRPVATELAEWILQNWSQEQISGLNAASQEVLREVRKDSGLP
jgi:hypothetical protein